ncbi:phage tail tape measure protein [Pragia fontium]|uniref:phage tail tape measure protein n=1 Tax=Pragia fontium TaxID=82985 RepID=UPI000F6F28C8|nr:phage tail tape measure protein [Pragia fontium]VEJ54635.1 Phage-related minor tail protein [Pragia fontium]
MADVATITLQVNTAPLAEGNKALDQFGAKAGHAAKSADSFGDSNKKAAKSTEEMAKSVDESHRRIAEFAKKLRDSGNSAHQAADRQDKLADSFFKQIDAIKEVDGASAKLKRIQDELGRANRAGELGQGNYVTLLGETTDKLNQVEKAESTLSRTKAEFLRRLKEQVATQKMSSEELLRYRAAQLGVGSSAEVYIKSLSASNKELTNLRTNSVSARREFGMMAAQLARGDISGLRGTALTTAGRSGLVEQLTTLRGLAVGGLLAGVAVGLVAVTKAYFQGAKESQEFNKQLILTGGYAGQTAGQLQALAASLSGNGVTQSNMAESLAKVVGTGSFSGGDISMIAGVAARMEDAVGQSIDETVKHFQKLKDEPAKAAQELDKSLHFLTATQLENILALENQGRASEAAKVAMDAYASAMNDRAVQIVDNLGWLESAWKYVGDAASGAWDKMLNIGRMESATAQLADVRRKILELQLDPKKQAIAAYNGDAGLDELRLQESLLSEQAYQEQMSAGQGKAIADEQERQKLRISQNDALNRKYENSQEKHLRTINEINNKYAHADQSVREKAVQAENKRFKEELDRETKKGRSSGAKSYTDDSATKMLLDSKQRLASLQEQMGATSQLTEQEKRLAEFTQQIAELKEKRILTADQKSILTRSDEIKASLELESSESRRLKNAQELAKGHETALKFIQQQEAAISAMQNSAGMSNREAQRNREREQTRMIKASPEDRDLALAKLEERYQREDELRGDWLAGAKKGFSEYLDSATDTYSAMSSVAQSALGGMSNMLTDLVTTGTTSFKQFTVSILKMIVDIINRMMIAYALQQAMGWIAGGASGGVANGQTVPTTPGNSIVVGYDSGGYTGDGGKYEPAGVVHRGEFVMTKEATARIGVNNLYSMMRGYADGGVVGKAPMHGLQSSGSSSGGVTVNMGGIVMNTGSDGNQQSGSGNTNTGAAIMKQLKPVIIAAITEQAQSPGTPLWNAISGGR